MTRTQTAYHASFSPFDIGLIIQAEERLSIGLRAQVEAVLTQLQPHDMISRTNGLCVAHSAAHAMRYLQAQPNPQGSPIYVYEVMVPRLAGLPMVLVDCIARSINHSLVYDIASEYWNPTEQWQFLESIVDEMEIVAVCSEIDPMALTCACLDYNNDYRRANERWQLPAST
jgi:hypothetical protein